MLMNSLSLVASLVSPLSRSAICRCEADRRTPRVSIGLAAAYALGASYPRELMEE